MDQVTKILNSIVDVRDEIQHLKKCKVNVYNGFLTKRKIIVNITSAIGTDYSVTYIINEKEYYTKFLRFLRSIDIASQ